MRHFPSLAIFVLLLKQQLKLTSSSKDVVSANNDVDLCGMYLAPSTIPGAGMGVFAGHRNITKGDFLLKEDGDLVVPAYEMTKHIGTTDYSFLWEEYTWRAASFVGMNEEVDDVTNVKACSTGLGAAINCILPLVNVVDDYDSRQLGLSGILMNSVGNKVNSTRTMPSLSSSLSSPGAGAFTPYYNRRWKAKKDIPAGMELYGNYGKKYFSSRSNYKKVPLIQNYREINNLLLEFQSITSDRNQITEEQRSDLLVFLQKLSVIWDESRSMYAIPQTDPPGDTSVVDWLLQQTIGAGMIHYNSSIRDLDWLQEHGRCMDNIRDGISRIPHAGRGAFARRPIPKGTIIAPAPLIQIPDRGVFTIYERKIIAKQSSYIHNNEKRHEFVTDHDKPVHQQLLLNYCFGHRESSLLLCPYGLMTSHINHDAINPNAKIAWANVDRMTHPEWREKPIEEWGTEEVAGLSFDFVALRNIEEDEEITIDYGSEWEGAWQKHFVSYYENEKFATNFDSNRQVRESISKHHVPAFEMNKLLDLRLQTMEEGDYENEGLLLFCRKPYLEWSGALITVLNDDDGTLLVGSATKANETIKLKLKEHTDWSNNEVFPCRIRHRYRPTIAINDIHNNVDYRYFAEIFERSEEMEYPHITKEYVWAAVFDVPRDAFYFKDQKNHRHHHQTWSFRHDMRIPDDIFPDAWRNKKNT